MSAPVSSGPSSVTKWGAAVLAALVAVAAGLLFAAVYFLLPAQHHYFGLLAIGILALAFSFVSYLAEALSRQPLAQRAFAWGFFGMGFTVLLVALALGPMFIGLSLVGQLIGLFVVIVALIAAVVFIGWRTRALAMTEARLRKREAWQSQPAPSALDYPAAHAPTTPQVPSPPPSGSAPPRSP